MPCELNAKHSKVLLELGWTLQWIEQIQEKNRRQLHIRFAFGPLVGEA